MKAIILLGHGARDPEWAKPMQRMQALIQARLSDTDVRLAFLELMAPPLNQVLDDVVQAGARQIDVVPVFLAQGGHVKRDVPNIVGQARSLYPDVQFHVRPVLGEMDHVIAALAECVIHGE